MVKRHELRVPGLSNEDAARDLVTSTISGFPIFGGLAAGLLGQAWQSKYEERIGKLLAEILRQLDILGAEQDMLREDVLSAFAVAVEGCSSSDEEKIQYLANALVNIIADDTVRHDRSLLLMRLVDQLTATHFRVLAIIDDPRAWEARTGLSVQPVQVESGNGYRAHLMIAQALGIDLDDGDGIGDVQMIIGDLEAKDLTATSGLGEPVLQVEPHSLDQVAKLSRLGDRILRLVVARV